MLCPLDTFLSLTKDLIVTNYPVECKSKSRFSVYIKINRICFKFLAPKSLIFLIDSKKNININENKIRILYWGYQGFRLIFFLIFNNELKNLRL